jgi:hypothetical protein
MRDGASFVLRAITKLSRPLKQTSSGLINMTDDIQISPFADDLWILRDLGFTPVIAEELGHMCVAWASLEWRLFCLFSRLSDLPVALARASFYTHHSTRNRTALVLRTAAMVLRGSQKREAVAKALERRIQKINRTAAKRNAYIHDPWAMTPGIFESTCQLRLSGAGLHGEGERVRGRDINQLTNQILVHVDAIHGIEDRISPILSTSLEKLDRTRSVTLVFPRTKRRRRDRQQAPPEAPRDPPPTSSE